MFLERLHTQVRLRDSHPVLRRLRPQVRGLIVDRVRWQELVPRVHVGAIVCEAVELAGDVPFARLCRPAWAEASLVTAKMGMVKIDLDNCSAWPWAS